MNKSMDHEYIQLLRSHFKVPRMTANDDEVLNFCGDTVAGESIYLGLACARLSREITKTRLGGWFLGLAEKLAKR